MIPSSRDRSWKADNASSSVAERYCRSPALVQPGVFGADAGIIEAGRNGVGVRDLPVIVHQEIGAIAVQHARATARERGRVQPARDAVPRRLDAVDRDLAVIEERDGTTP